MPKSEHDEGFEAGWRLASEEVLRICQNYIDRLEPGEKSRRRDALEELKNTLNLALVISKRPIRKR